MRVVACEAPTGLIEPAPLTSLPLAGFVGNREVATFWGSDDAYYLRAVPSDQAGQAEWFRLEADVADEGSMSERIKIAALMANITPLGAGRVAFPVGSTGRRFYRVWRANPSTRNGRTRILEVRAARSRRLPA